jgi:putative hemolysin
VGLVHEYGTFRGVVTNGDILAAIVDFHTGEDPTESAFTKRADRSYLTSAGCPALEFADLLGTALPASRPYQTVADFQLQKIRNHSRRRRHGRSQRLRFEILDRDRPPTR